MGQNPGLPLNETTSEARSRPGLGGLDAAPSQARLGPAVPALRGFHLLWGPESPSGLTGLGGWMAHVWPLGPLVATGVPDDCVRNQPGRSPRLGGACRMLCSAGHGADLLIFISVILWFSRNMTKPSLIMQSPTRSAVHSRLSGYRPAPPHRADGVTRPWEGARAELSIGV